MSETRHKYRPRSTRNLEFRRVVANYPPACESLTKGKWGSEGVGINWSVIHNIIEVEFGGVKFAFYSYLRIVNEYEGSSTPNRGYLGTRPTIFMEAVAFVNFEYSGHYSPCKFVALHLNTNMPDVNPVISYAAANMLNLDRSPISRRQTACCVESRLTPSSIYPTSQEFALFI